VRKLKIRTLAAGIGTVQECRRM